MLQAIRRPRSRGAAILEYVIIAVGIAIFCTLGILLFGKTAQSQMNQATQVLSGQQSANSTAVTAGTAATAASASDQDDQGRAGQGMARQ